jgi:hypothetical protein
MHKRR